MTKAQLNKLEIYEVSSIIDYRTHWCNITNTPMTLTGDENYSAIGKLIFKEGIKQGKND